MRPYVDADLAALKAALASWVLEAGRCGYCHPGDLEHRIHREAGRTIPAFVWEDDAGIAGIEISGRFDKVFDVFARPDCRGDAEREMLRAATTRFGETDAFACDAVRRALLRDLGFTEHRTWDHLRVRDLERLPDVSVPKGFIAQAMGGDLTLIAPDGRAAATATIWFDDVTHVGLFEPIETHEGFRRIGLARALMAEGLRRMRAVGMHTALVEHDITNEPAAALYASLGFAVAFETLGFRHSPSFTAFSRGLSCGGQRS